MAELEPECIQMESNDHPCDQQVLSKTSESLEDLKQNHVQLCKNDENGCEKEFQDGGDGNSSENLISTSNDVMPTAQADFKINLGAKSTRDDNVAQHTSGTPTMTPKKSNLKRPKCVTPDLNGLSYSATSKRIRIVENLDVGNSNNYIQLNDEGENNRLVQAADETASVVETEICGERIAWLNSTSSFIDQSLVNVEYVRDNLSPVKRSFSVEIDMRFILSDAVTAILSSKTKITKVGAADFHLWVNRMSKFDLAGSSKLAVLFKENFIKMANLDGLLNHDLTSPKELISTAGLTDAENIYYVGDLWHDSKGFREYLLWKTSQNQDLFSTKILTMKINGPRSTEKCVSKKTGILFSQNSNLFTSNFNSDSEDLRYLSTEMVEHHERYPESDTILDSETISSFINFVNSRTNEKGLHVLLVDNPEVSHVYESCREVRYQKYFYCECLIALRCVRQGGTFICKIFDSFTLFTTGVIFLLYKCFKSITIHKPTSSPQYTSERFLICTGKIDNADSKYAVDFLYDCLDMVVNKQEQRKIVRRRVRRRVTLLKMEVQAIVPLKLILSHAEFFQFVRQSNIRLCLKLSDSINQLCTMMEDNTTMEHNSRIWNSMYETLKAENMTKLSTWKVLIDPPCIQDLFLKLDPMERCRRFLAEKNINEGAFTVNQCGNEEIKSLPSKESWIAFPIQGSNKSAFRRVQGYFFGCGENKVMHFDNKSWYVLEYAEFSLPYGTILMGEIAEELCCMGKKKIFVRYFHVFDAVFLSGKFIGRLPFENRQKMVTRFTNCLSQQNFRVIHSLALKDVSSFFNSTSIPDEVVGYCAGMRLCPYIRDANSFTDQLYSALVGGFMLVRNRDDGNPNQLLSNNQLYWLWGAEAQFGAFMESKTLLASTVTDLEPID